jgi:type II secretory pathway pseudopilin PulG
MPLCINCGKKEVKEGVWFCPDCSGRLEKRFTREERQKHIQEPRASTRERRPIEGAFIAKLRYGTNHSQRYRIGFVVMLILALVGLVASINLSNQLNTTQSQLAAIQSQSADEERELALYKDTYGSVVESGVKPPFQGANIVSYEGATNPTWAQLVDFLLQDTTDQNPYVPGVYVCGDYARDVHNIAEQYGIRAAYVVVELPSGYHALNAFKTTDRGLVFIDCTGLESGEAGPSNRDKIVDVKSGEDYIPSSLFPEPGWSSTWGDMGTILDVQIYW